MALGASLDRSLLLTVRNCWASGATFERRVLLMVQERFTPRAISGKKMDINGPGPFWLQESVFKVFAHTVLEQFWLCEPALRAICYLRSGDCL